MAASFAGLGLLWFTSSAWAQEPSLPPVPAQAPAQTSGGTITYIKEANSTVPAKKTSTLIPSVSDTATLPAPVPAVNNESSVPPLPPLEPPVHPVAMPSALPTRVPPAMDAGPPAVGAVPSSANSMPAATIRPTSANTSTLAPAASGRAGTLLPPTTRQVARQSASPKGAPPSSRPGYPGTAKDDETEAEDQSPPPGPNALFKLESETSWMERMRQDSRSKGTMERQVFPDEPPVSTEKYAARQWKPYRLDVEPSYVCYTRLYFEDKNAERYGWDLGPLHPVLSTTKFFYDCALLPYNVFSDPFNRMESSAGYCLPGDPVPLMIYPPKLSLTGLIAEVGAATALVYIFP